MTPTNFSFFFCKQIGFVDNSIGNSRERNIYRFIGFPEPVFIDRPFFSRHVSSFLELRESHAGMRATEKLSNSN